MSRHDSAPTHGWVVGSRVNKWLALLFILSLLVWFITIYTITYTIRRDCTDIYKRDVTLFGYWLHIEAGSDAPECPAYES